jgi:hypothetical protein
MTAEQWQSALRIYNSARERPSQARRAFVESESPDPEVVQEALELLESASDPDSAPASVAIPTDRAGMRIGRFEIGCLLGRGGMGEVWVARDMELDRQVALKFLMPEVGFAGAVEHLRREAKMISALNHPNIVTVYEVISNQEAPIIVMELVNGKSLREICGTRPRFHVLAYLGLQIAQALAAAHAQAIIHRDIKPENIFIRPDGYLELLDFGLARQVTKGRPARGGDLFGGVFSGGTLRYMSPEQVRGESPSPASDIFSFGLVLYELATGRHAFPRDSAGETTRAILAEPAPAASSVNSDVPPRLDSLIASMLARNPALRPSAEDVARTLGDPRTLAAASDPGASIVAARRRKWISAALLVLLAPSFLFWLWKHRSTAGRQPPFYQVTTLLPENRATAAAISPDGKWTAYANFDGIFLRAMRNGETRALRAPVDFVVDRLEWFDHGAKLVASGFSAPTHLAAIWIVSTTGAPPRLLRSMARQGCPSPDGTRIAFTSADRSAIWTTRSNGDDARQVLAGAAGDSFPVVFWSATARRLGFVRRHYSAKNDNPSRSLLRYYQRDYESLALDTGKVVARVPDLWIASAAVLPDNRMLFLKWDSRGSDGAQLWEVRTAPATGALLEAPRKIALPINSAEIELSDMSATADGGRIMVLKVFSRKVVFVGDFGQSPPGITGIHRLTLDERNSYPHAWTRDSRAVIFESDRNGSLDLLKQYIDRRTPEIIVATPLAEVLPQLSPDGRFVLYEARPQATGSEGYNLMRVPLEGGTPEPVPIGGRLDEFRCAIGNAGRCVLKTTTGRKYYVYYDLDPVAGKGRELARTRWMPGVLGDWDVSPDGKYVVLPNHDSRHARIRVLALQPGPADLRERELALPGLSDIHGLVWSADGRGWFISVDTSVGSRLLYVYPDGRFQPLGDISGWVVPSPDGRRVTLLDRIVAKNAWLIDRR